MTTITIRLPEDKDEAIKELYRMKSELLDKYGVFGGGSYVNGLHKIINDALELRGIAD